MGPASRATPIATDTRTPSGGRTTDSPDNAGGDHPRPLNWLQAANCGREAVARIGDGIGKADCPEARTAGTGDRGNLHVEMRLMNCISEMGSKRPCNFTPFCKKTRPVFKETGRVCKETP